jgi:hypothetical protein
VLTGKPSTAQQPGRRFDSKETGTQEQEDTPLQCKDCLDMQFRFSYILAQPKAPGIYVAMEKVGKGIESEDYSPFFLSNIDSGKGIPY